MISHGNFCSNCLPVIILLCGGRAWNLKSRCLGDKIIQSQRYCHAIFFLEVHTAVTLDCHSAEHRFIRGPNGGGGGACSWKIFDKMLHSRAPLSSLK